MSVLMSHQHFQLLSWFSIWRQASLCLKKKQMRAWLRGDNTSEKLISQHSFHFLSFCCVIKVICVYKLLWLSPCVWVEFYTLIMEIMEELRHCGEEGTKTKGKRQQRAGGGNGRGRDEKKVGGGVRVRIIDRASRGESEQCQRQQQWLATTGLPVNHATHTHSLTLSPLSIGGSRSPSGLYGGKGCGYGPWAGPSCHWREPLPSRVPGPADLGEVSQNLLTWLVSPVWHSGLSDMHMCV